MIGAELHRLVETRRREISVPIDARRLLREVGPRPHVGGSGEILAGLARRMGARDLDLQVVDALRLRRGVRLPRRGQQPGDIGLILRAQRGHLRIGRQIIFALGQPEPALQYIGNDVAGGRETLRHEDAEQVFGVEVGRVERIDVGARLFAQHLRQRRLVADRREAREVGLDRLHPRSVDRVGADIGLVESGDAAGVAVRIPAPLDDRVDQFARALLGFEESRIEGAGRRAVGGNLGGLLPVAVRIGIEIVAGLDARVHRRLADAQLGADGIARLLLVAALRAGDGPRDDRGGGQEKDEDGFSHGSGLACWGSVERHKPAASRFQCQPNSACGPSQPTNGGIGRHACKGERRR